MFRAPPLPTSLPVLSLLLFLRTAEEPRFPDVASQRHRLPASPSTANEGRNDYHPMFFTHDRAFEELFGICIQLLNKTWKEMRATAEDFNKVRVAEL